VRAGEHGGGGVAGGADADAAADERGRGRRPRARRRGRRRRRRACPPQQDKDAVRGLTAQLRAARAQALELLGEVPRRLGG